MKKILLACDNSRIDVPLRKSLAHLAKSCKIAVAPDGYRVFDEISAQAFNLIIVDSQLPGIDSLEVIEGIQHVDPGAPVILILNETYKGIWDTVRQLKAHPITRPFKPLRFLRLVDKLLHQHLNHYRKLAERLKTILETLRNETSALCAYLVEDSGQILFASGGVAGIALELLGNLAVDSSALDGETQELSGQDGTPPTDYQLGENHGLYVSFVADNLHLALISPVTANFQESAATWQQIDNATSQAKVALYDQLRTDISPSSSRNNTISHKFIPLKLNFGNGLSPAEDDDDEIAVNWEIISDTSNLLSRLDDFCRID